MTGKGLTGKGFTRKVFSEEELRRIRNESEKFEPFWDKHGQRYAETFPIREEVLDYFEKHKNDCGKTLDHGCGVGRHFFPLLDRGIDVYGFDSSPQSIRKAQEYGNKRYGAEWEPERLRVASMFDLEEEYGKEVFDTVLSWAVLYESRILGVSLALDQVYRVLKPNGKLFAMMRMGSPPPKARIVSEGDGWISVIEHNNLPRTYFSEKGFLQLAEDTGFSVQEILEPFVYGSRKNATGQEFILQKDAG